MRVAQGLPWTEVLVIDKGVTNSISSLCRSLGERLSRQTKDLLKGPKLGAHLDEK